MSAARLPDLPPDCRPADPNLIDSGKGHGSYGQIFRSSSIIGGAQVINVVIGMVRMKLVAVLIGPSGVGLLGIYQSITGLAGTIAGLGLQTSGVREVARYHGLGDLAGIARTITTLRRVCWFTGLAGMLSLAALSPWVSQATMGSKDYAWAVAMLGVTILFGNLAAGQGAIVQGTRRIGDIARMQIASALAGTIVAGVFYGWLGSAGIVPALIALSLVSLSISTYFACRVKKAAVMVSWSESIVQATHLVRLGIALVWSAALAGVVTYATQAMILRDLNVEAVGVYAAAYTLSAMFVNFVLSAMAADFYPRLTANSNNHARMTNLVNEQTEVGLLLAFPGLLATLLFAPFVIPVLYTSEFAPASGLLKWLVLGCMGRVLSWPLGFCLLAKGQGILVATTESVSNVVHLLMIWAGLSLMGLTGVAVAFALLYVLHTMGMLIVTHMTIGFRWSRNVLNQLAWMVPTALSVFAATWCLPDVLNVVFGGIVMVGSAVACLRQLALRLGTHHRVTKAIIAVPGGSAILKATSI
ncbi:O-antigen translocase [Candidatus Laterigemmans baculatus]|nr:O-antigen translocase [Candidatus Laterigemmans baculatus]